MTLYIAVVAITPSASDNTAIAVNHGCFARFRRPKRTSRKL